MLVFVSCSSFPPPCLEILPLIDKQQQQQQQPPQQQEEEKKNSTWKRIIQALQLLQRRGGVAASKPPIQSNRNYKQIICYARKYSHILQTGDASVLLTLTGPQRRHAMEALTVLSKQIGRYEQWQSIRKRYSLKWTNGNESLQALQRFFDNNLTLDSMLSKVKEMMRVLPAHMAAIIRFACLTGLRPSEACESVRLLYACPQYYNPQQQTLEHFRYPSVFIRPTKKAFLSYLSLDNYYHYFAKNIGKTPTTLAAITSACKRRNIPMNMHLCRKVFASWLRHKGIEPEIVDLLQGRVSHSILTRHYLAPSQDLKDRVLLAVEQLQKKQEQEQQV
jgi:integrase